MTNQKKHDKYMLTLQKMARDVVPVSNARVAACLVYKNKIVSFGINRKKSHPFQARFASNDQSIYLHAEIDAIKNGIRSLSDKELSKSTLYVCRIIRSDKLALSKPCPGCASCIEMFDVRKVIYSLNDQVNYGML